MYDPNNTGMHDTTPGVVDYVPEMAPGGQNSSGIPAAQPIKIVTSGDPAGTCC